VTIGVGFHCGDGVVLAADRQLTVEGVYKTHSMKIGNFVYGGATVLWTFAGLPNLVSVMRDGVFAKLNPFPPGPSEQEIAKSISEQMMEMKEQYPEEMRTQQFLFAYSCGQAIGFSQYASGVVNDPPHAYIGIGDSSLINYIFDIFCSVPTYLMSIKEGSTLAICMVALAKQFVDGCGGPIDVVMLQANDAQPFFVPAQWVEDIESNFGDQMRHILRLLYSILTIKNLSDEHLEQSLEVLKMEIKAFRKILRDPLSGYR